MAIFSLQEELCAYIAIIPFDRIAIIQNGSLTIHMQITPSTSILLFIVATPRGKLLAGQEAPFGYAFTYNGAQGPSSGSKPLTGPDRQGHKNLET